jgi:hypothetical protein
MKQLAIFCLLQLVMIAPAWGAVRITIPATPLNVVAYSASSNSIRLAWLDSSTNETGYKIERALSAGGKYSQIAAIAANATNYLNTGLKPSTVYYYRIRSYNSRGNSKYSNVASAKTDAICNYVIAPTETSVDFQGGPGSLTLSTATNICSWSATSLASWVSIVSGNGGTGPAQVNYFVASNSSTNSRTGALNVAGKTFTITQSGAPACNYSLGSSTASFSFGANSGSAEVIASGNCSWTATANVAWLTILGGTTGTGNGTVSFSVAENPDAAPRTGTLTIAGQTFTVNQEGGPAIISLGEAVDNLALEWSSVGDAVWFGQASQSLFGGDAAQSGPITDGQISWLQTTVTGPATLSFHWKVSSEEGYDTLQFLVDDSQQFSISGEVDWQQRSISLDAGTHTIGWIYWKDFCCSAGADRAWLDQVEVSGVTCDYALSSTSASLGAEGGTGGVTVTVTGGASCQWTASSLSSWITLVSGFGASGSGTVGYSVAPNPGVDQRVGTLSVAGQIVSITQAGSVCSCVLSPLGFNHGAGNEGGSFSVTAPVGCGWVASTAYQWIHTASSGSGTGTASYSVDANASSSPRSGTITVGSQTFTVNQAGVSCAYALSPLSFSHGSGSGSSSFSMTAPAGCGWGASSTYTWIHTSSSGNGSGTISYSVDANSSTSSRSGTITAGGQTFTVNQAGVSCTFALGSSSFTHGAGSGNGSFSITAPSGCAWAASTAYTWIHTISSGNGNGTVSYTVDANSSTSSRSGTITAGGQTFTVNQSGVSCTFALSSSSASPGSGGGSGSFSMIAPTGCAWAASTAFAWIHTTSSGNGNGTVNYTVDANSSTSARSGTITAGGQTFTVNQAGVSCTFALSASSASAGSGGGSGSFSMIAPSGCAWAASTAFAWIHTTSSGNGNGTVSYTVDANSSTSARSGTITAGGQTFTVNQAGVVCTYTLGSTSFSHGAGTESGSFGITAPTACTWNASTAFAWIHTSSGGTGNGTVSYTVDANSTTSARSGTINVGGQVFTVNQAGISCTYALGTTSFNHGAGAESGSFGVTAPGACSWAASTAFGWIHTTSSGSGNGTVSYTVDANSATSARSGTINLAGQTFTVNQAGVSCSYSLSAASASFGASAASGTVGVTAPGGCVWVATSGAGWITITSGSSATGNGAVGYSVASNGSTGSRSGTMTIAGQTFTVTQSGSGVADSTPPAASFLSPASGSFLSGSVQLKAMVTDNASIGTVEFYVDNNGDLALVGTSQGAGTLSTNIVSFNTAEVLNGQHTFYCRPFDAAGNSSWAWVTVTISNYNADPGTLMWAKDVGISPVSGEAQNMSVKADGQGNQVVAGKFSGSVNFGGTILTSSGAYDLFVAKFNVDGSMAWVRRFGGIYDNVATSVAVDGADNVLVTGYFVGAMDLGGGLLTSGGGNNNPDVFVVKFSGAGAHVWSKRFGGAYGNFGYGIGVDSNNDVFVVGQYSVQADFGGGPVQSAGGGDGFLAKFSGQNGTYMWARSFGGSGSDYPQGLAVDGNGDALVTGYSTGSMDFGGGLRPNAGGSDAFLAKFSGANGAHVWSKMVGGTGNEGANGIAVDASGNGVLAGSFTSSLNLGGVNLLAPLSTAMFIAKYDSASGALMWAMSVGGTSSIGGTVGPRVAGVDSAGNVIVTGNATGEADFGNGILTAGTGNIFLAKYSPTGSYLWSKRFSSTGWSAGMGLAIDRSRNIIATGSFSGSANFDGVQLNSLSSQTRDAFLLKFTP